MKALEIIDENPRNLLRDLQESISAILTRVYDGVSKMAYGQKDGRGKGGRIKGGGGRNRNKDPCKSGSGSGYGKGGGKGGGKGRR